jgi:demethylmenaquinone methyltransferase/2-methoxy-6-polyprenyl-1,4-benzoquinol methylase
VIENSLWICGDFGLAMHPLREFFNSLAQEWDGNQPQDRVKTIHALLRRFDETLSTARTILDVGTGTGELIPILKQRYPRARIISLDFAHQMCLRAAQRISTVQITQGDVHALPFPCTAFDAVICHNSFPHFSDKQRALKDLARVLNQPGTLLVLHDISRARVNQIHQNAQAQVIHDDLLPECSVLAGALTSLGLIPEIVEDNASHYIICAKNP